MSNIIIPDPKLQISFSKILHNIRETYLQEALSKTIDLINISRLDKELSDYVPQKYLKSLAKHGLRGELIYPVPYLLESNPYLLGYYRLLLGFSQKEFYTAAFGVSIFKNMEMKLINAADRKVYIEFASDPDIVIREEIGKENFRNIVAIEVKGGKDFSNIHNRIGEAEKSHQKAKQSDYVECWTVVNVDRIDLEMAKKESPTTNKFFILSQLVSQKGNEYQNFKEHIISLTGIKM